MSTRSSTEHTQGPARAMIGNRTSWALVAWWPHSRRSEAFAAALGGTLHCIRYLHLRPPLYAPLRYILQAVRTLWILFTERPQWVHVQNPPFACGLAVSVFCLLTGSKFVLDHHSAAFARVWDLALPIQKLLAQQAVTNIVTNQHWADTIRSWDASALIMGDPFLALPEGEAFSVSPGFNIAFVGTFAPDEPLDEVLEAASQLPQVHFYVTGDTRHKTKSFIAALPPNITCTGFLPEAQYIGLLRAVDAIMVLTTRDHTLQLGGCEAVSVGQPLITSDWPFLRDFFRKGTIHIPNTAAGICKGIDALKRDHGRLIEEMLTFREAARREWDVQLAQLVQLVEGTN